MAPRTLASPQLVARTNAYRALSRTLADPTCWDTDESSRTAPPFERMAEPLPTLAGELATAMRAAHDDLESLRVAYAKLFLGPFQVEAPPYASYYLDPEQKLMGDVSLAVAESYSEAGLGPAPGPRDAPDHITHELEFMYFLGFQAARTNAVVWQRRAHDFWQKHLACWLPQFAEKITAARLHPFYDTLGRLLSAFEVAEACYFAER